MANTVQPVGLTVRESSLTKPDKTFKYDDCPTRTYYQYKYNQFIKYIENGTNNKVEITG